ncbi:MAG: ANTAR domain-containing protein [Lachnospiraceae bacterium]|nr:ANTAR domain-containing protein [Lachnospiraceae bacterium]
MPQSKDIYHSVLIVSASESFDQLIKKSLTGFVTCESKRSVASARMSLLERYYDLIVINSPLPDETGEVFAIDAAEKSNASVLLVVSQDIYEETLQRVTDYGIIAMPKPSPKGRMDKIIRFLIALQNKMREQERKLRAAEEKIEELRMVDKAKFTLMEQKHMTEDEAHRYIGKQAMDNGVSRGRAARMILDELE